MARLLAIYSQPADAAAFDRYYHGTHLPLFGKVAGVRKVAFSVSPQAIAGDTPYLITEVTFDSIADIHTALASPEGKAAAADLANFAQAGVAVLIYDQRDGAL